MKVSVGCQGRFHLFDLARQMYRLGHLAHLYTGYPRFKVRGLPFDRVSTFPWLMGPYMAYGRLIGRGPRRFEHLSHVTFDRWVASQLAPCEVYHWLCSVGLRTLEVARSRYGALTVCDRPSTHIRYQDRIMAEEFDRQGIPYTPIDPRIVARQMAEYDACDLIVVPSELNLRSFVENGVAASRLRKLPYGVDLQAFRPRPKHDDVFRVLTVCQLSLRKGIPYLLEALAPLKLPAFELCLAGAPLPETRAILSRYEGRFRHLGVIPRARLAEVYSQASVFVLASVEEGLALVQAEAMACGLPVIATTNTGAEDLFTDGVEGFIVPIRDPEAIREKVLMLYRDRQLREQMAQAALRRVRAIGGWNTYGESAARIYAEALAQRDRSPVAAGAGGRGVMPP